MSGSIRLSEQHGVNPSLGLCFWCGQEDGTVLLLGRLPDDAEAPRRACATYAPCEACQAKFAQGIMLIECATSAPAPRAMPIRRDPDLYPTGNYLVVTEDAVKRIFSVEHGLAVLMMRKALLSQDAFQRLTKRED